MKLPGVQTSEYAVSRSPAAYTPMPVIESTLAHTLAHTHSLTAKALPEQIGQLDEAGAAIAVDTMLNLAGEVTEAMAHKIVVIPT